MRLSATYRRFLDDGGEAFPLDQVIYRAPDGRLLDVVHDLDALRETSADKWKALFDKRAGARSYPDRSGVWGKREWVLPELAGEHILSLGEGNTQLLELPRLARDLGLSERGSLAIKQCGQSHTGSFKDWGMTVLVSQVLRMRSMGVPIAAVGCASTGDTSAALAAYAALGDIPAVVFLPADKISVAQLVQPIANGALVLSLDTDFDGCMRLIREVVEVLPIYLANSMNSLRIEGQKTVAIEIAQQRDWQPPDWVVVPGGNLGNVYALFKGFGMMRDLGLIDRMPRLAVAQAEHASPLAKAYATVRGNGTTLGDLRAAYAPETARKTLASAIQIGDPVSIDRAIHALQQTNGVAASATESELAEASARADRRGLFTCPHTGVALAVAEKLIADGTIGKDEHVVVVSTAHGLKFTDGKVAYHSGRLGELFAGVPAAHKNPPVALPANVGSVIDALRSRLAL
jgi:threonine synthase